MGSQGTVCPAHSHAFPATHRKEEYSYLKGLILAILRKYGTVEEGTGISPHDVQGFLHEGRSHQLKTLPCATLWPFSPLPLWVVTVETFGELGSPHCSSNTYPT